MARCGRCHEDNPERARFCLACGAELAAVSGDNEVRKTVTLLFADVFSSTVLGEQLETEALRAVMGRYFDAARAVVERHGGTVEKFIGDAVLAVFGVPVVHEDDALRAVRAAAGIHEALDRLNQELGEDWGVRIVVRIGVNTGEVVVGSARAGGSFATGDAVNVAARLEQACEPGGVLLGEPTYRLVADWVEADPVPPLSLKGKSELVEARLLRGVLPRPRPSTDHRQAPLVGRESELALLHAAMSRATDSPRAFVATVAGPAGVGKSRLVAEVARAFAADATVLHGTCLSYGEGAALWPVREIVRNALDISLEGAPPEDAVDRLAALLGTGAEATLTVQRLAAVADLGGTPGSATEIAVALQRLLVALAEKQPVVVTLEDLHYAEASLLDLLEATIQGLDDAPVFVVATARNELWDQRPTWPTGAFDKLTTTVPPLAPRHAATLAGHLLGGDVDDSVQTALENADGNPLFIEHVVAVLRDRQALQQVKGRWRLVAEAVVDEVPDTVHAILAARIDQLSLPERTLLERASVLGCCFPRTAVAPMLPDDIRPTADALVAQLRAKGLLCVSHDGSQQSFANVLLRETAYDRVPKSVRSQLHVRFVEWLDAQPERDGNTEELAAYHLLAAAELRRELGPLDADALELLGQCTDRALRAVEALSFIEADTARRLVVHAWDVCGREQPARLELLPAILRVFAHAADVRTFLRLAAEADTQAAGVEEWELIARIVRCAAQLEHSTQDLDDWDAAVAAARAKFHDDAKMYAIVARVDAVRHTAGDKPAAAMMNAHEEAAAAAERAGDPEMRAHALGDVATFLHFTHLPLDDILQRALQVDEALEGRPLVQSRSRSAVALALAEMGRATEGRAAADQARELHRLATGSDFDPTYSGFFLADVEVLCGDPEAGCAILRRSVDELTTAGETGYRYNLLGMWLRHAAMELGQVADDELTVLATHLQTYDKENDLPFLRAAADLAAGRGVDAESAQRLAQLWRRRVEVHGPYLGLDAAPIVIRTLHRAGLDEDAAGVQAESVEIADRLGYQVRGARIRALLPDAASVSREAAVVDLSETRTATTNPLIAR